MLWRMVYFLPRSTQLIHQGIVFSTIWLSLSSPCTKRTAFDRMKNEQNFFSKSSDNPNVQHFHLALTAEFLALKAHKTDETVSTFEKAIAVATRSGFIMDAALMNERFAEFLMDKDDERGIHHIKSAHSLYMEWGSSKKCELLELVYPSIMPHPINVYTQGSTAGSRGGSSSNLGLVSMG